jgi:hypothetical protein
VLLGVVDAHSKLGGVSMTTRALRRILVLVLMLGGTLASPA